MKAETKAAKIAAMFGLEAPKKASPNELRRQANHSREAEAVILYHEDRTKFQEKVCRICNRIFAVNRSHIAFCSDDCRSVHINDVLGLEWSPTGRSPEERWTPQTGGLEPLIVPPVALELLNLTQTQTPQTEVVESEEESHLDSDFLSALDSLLEP